jgi:hypothetical protein
MKATEELSEDRYPEPTGVGVLFPPLLSVLLFPPLAEELLGAELDEHPPRAMARTRAPSAETVSL